MYGHHQLAEIVRDSVKTHCESVGIVIKMRRVPSISTSRPCFPQSLRDIPVMDETTYKYLGFEMKNGEVTRTEMVRKHEERTTEKLEEPTPRVDVFDARNRVHFINQTWCPNPKNWSLFIASCTRHGFHTIRGRDQFQNQVNYVG